MFVSFRGLYFVFVVFFFAKLQCEVVVRLYFKTSNYSQQQLQQNNSFKGVRSLSFCQGSRVPSRVTFFKYVVAVELKYYVNIRIR